MNKVIFWGTPEFALPSLESLHKLGLVSAVVTQPDRPTGRSKQLVASPVKEFALQNSLAILELVVLDQAFVNKLEKFLPATFVVVAYGKIIALSVLNLSQLPAINIHPSQLPSLRGPSPIQSALLAGYDRTAVTLMQMDDKMDHGPILSQIEANIEPWDDYLSLSQRLAKIAAELLGTNIKAYLKGSLKAQAQDDTLATFCKLIKKEDGLINWSKPASEINNMIRAYTPWPSAYTKISGIDLKIKKAEIFDLKLAPGELKIDINKLLVGTADKSLSLVIVQPAGKKAMSIADFIRGYKEKIKMP